MTTAGYRAPIFLETLDTLGTHAPVQAAKHSCL
jgi:hypothetical protein